MEDSQSDSQENSKVLTPAILKLGLISFFADVSSEMLYPITPIFLTTILGASMTSVGLVEGVAESIASLLKTYFGMWSDRISKRKPFIVVGYLFAALGKPLTGVSTTWFQVLLAKALDRTGKGLRTAPRDALLAESASPANRGAAFGWHRAMDTFGAAVGPILAIAYLSSYSDYTQHLRTIYFYAFIPGIFAVLISLLIVEKHKEKPTKKIEFKFSMRTFSRPFKIYLTSWTIFSLTNSSDVFLIMKAKQQGQTLARVILMYCFYNLVYSLLSPYFGKLSDRLGRKKILIIGLFIFAMVYSGFSFAVSPWHFWVLFGIYGLYMALTEGNGKAMAVDLVNPSEKATGLGVLGTFVGFSTVIASTVAGAIWDHLGSQWTFLYGAIGAVIAAFIMAIV
jgi:MFS family permease